MPDAYDLYPRPAPPMNPLDTAGKAFDLIGAMNRNRLFQAEFGSQQAIGNALAGATDASGNVDINKAMSAAARNPNAAFGLPEFAQAGQTLKSSQLSNQSAQLALAISHNSAMNNRITQLLARQPGGLKLKDVQSELTKAAADGSITPQQAASESAAFSARGDDEEGLRQMLSDHLVQNLDTQQKLNAIYGSPQSFETGNMTRVEGVSPVTGAHPIANYPLGLSPGQSASLVGTVDPNTLQPVNITTGQALNRLGVSPSTGGAAPPPAPTRFNPLNGQPIEQPQQQSQPAMPAPAAAQAAPAAVPATPGTPPATQLQPRATPAPVARTAGGLPAAPPPGVVAGVETAARGSAETYTQLAQDIASGAQQQRISALSKAATALESTATGPGTAARNSVLSFLTSFGALKDTNVKFLRDIQQDSAFYDEAKKYLTAYASTGNIHSDAQLATALSANASTDISNLAAKNVVRAALGSERFKTAMVNEFQQTGLRPDQFTNWASTIWNRNRDVRGFVLDMMTPDQKAELKRLPAAEKKRIVDTHQWAEQNGYLQ